MTARQKRSPTEAGTSPLVPDSTWGLGGEVRIGQAAVQHFSKVTWVRH